MSYVTDVVIHYNDFDDQVSESLTETLPNGEALAQMPYLFAGGSKAMQTNVYVGAFNYLNTEMLIQWFLSRQWTTGCRAVLSMDEEAETYVLVEVRYGIVSLHEPDCVIASEPEGKMKRD